MSRNETITMTETPAQVFVDVQKTFYDSLSHSERRSFQPFADASSMVTSIEQTVHRSPIHKSRLTACLPHVRALADRFTPFFDICGMFVSSNPDFAALVWGSIRLVFQLGSNHVTFLEKICDMFGQMQRVLPAYNEIIEKLPSRTSQNNKNMRHRMVSALALVYSDMVHFCFDACSVFTRRRTVLGLKWPLSATLLWRPFDARFEAIIRRFKDHKELMDLEMNVSTHEHVVKVSNRLDSMLNSTASQRNVPDEFVEDQKQAAMKQRLDSLKAWIDPPSWLSTYEDVDERHTPTTSDWFIENPRVQTWLGRMGQRDQAVNCNLLSVQAKPGYGKTTLCSVLIGHLASIRRASPLDSSSNNVVFFYFDKQNKRARQLSDAYRAILSQLLQIHGGSEKGIDVTSLLWYQTNSGQQTASDNDIKELLTLISSQTNQLVLILDGVDECTDTQYLFNSLDAVGFTSATHSIALFSRPTARLPKRLSTHALTIALKNSQNLEDIRRYLRRRIQDMVDDDILPEEVDVEATVETISSRADGMFLWVTLLTQYLYMESPALTMNQLRRIIKNLSRLKGLDAMYGAIIQSLSQKYQGEAKGNVQRLFQWVVCSLRPLQVSELNCAISVPLDRKLESDDEFGDLSKSLSVMSGALLEMGHDQTVRFIHLSAFEYFQSSSSQATDAREMETYSDSFESFHSSRSHVYCSLVCLSYMLHTVSVGPLSGDHQTSVSEAALRYRFPLLDYASEHWSRHMLGALDIKNGDLRPSDLDFLGSLVSLIGKFMSNKGVVTTWVEACWTFGRNPHIVNAQEQLEIILDLSHYWVAQNDRSLDSVKRCMKDLGKLAEDLASLDRSWSKVLLQTPNEIWEPSISAFLKSDFWLSFEGSRVAQLSSSSQESGFICINSRVSDDGKELASIKVQPPEYDTGDPAGTDKAVWKVRYEVWSLESMRMRICTSFHVPSGMVPFLYIWQQKDKAEDDAPILEFLFPTTISANLRHVVFLHLAGSLVDETITSVTDGVQVSERTLKMQLQVLDTSLRTGYDACGSFSLDWQAFHRGFWTHMSESGEYLLVLHFLPTKSEDKINHPTDIPLSKLWFARIYRNEAFAELRGPRFTLLATIAFVPDRITELADRPFHFHPTLPLLVFASGRTAWIERVDQALGVSIVHIAKAKPVEMSQFQIPQKAVTLMWNFTRKGSTPISIGSVMEDVGFSNDGTKVYGKSCGRSIMVDIPTDQLLGDDNASKATKSETDLVTVDGQVAIGSRSTLLSLSSGQSAVTQKSNTMSFARDSRGRPVVTDLRQSSEHGSLVLRTLRDNIMTQETLTRLPTPIDTQTVATLLKQPETCGSEAEEIARIVLNRAAGPFEKFTSGDASFVPTVLERRKRTIPSFVGSSRDLLRDSKVFPTGFLGLE